MRPVADFPIAGTGCHARLPQIRVGVVRDQGESLLTPANDVVPYLESQPGDRWQVHSFDERDFGGLLGAAEFDVIVIGYNATLFTPALRRALEATPPTTPVLMLHQRDQDCFAFLRDELAVTVVPLGEGVEEARTPRERTDAFEPLLNWPYADVVDRHHRLRAKAIRGLSFSPDGAWRVVLDVLTGAQRVPALIRSRSNHRQRLVACSLLLQPGLRPAHARLLENLLVYCAFGWPDVGLVELADGPDAGRIQSLATGMGIWTERRVEVVAPSVDAIPIADWPLQGVKRVVAPERVDLAAFTALDGAEAWMRRGGELVRVAPSGDTTIHGRVSDRFLVLREWAVWFASLGEDAWLRRLSPARAVLGLLDAARGDAGSGALRDLRFDADPAQYADGVRELLDGRIRHHNVDETVSATVAALDLDRLVGGDALGGYERHRVEDWLEAQVSELSPADRFDVLRCLGDRDGLAAYVGEWWGPGTRLDALALTRLREAVRACWPDGSEPQDLVPAGLLDAVDGAPVVDDLNGRPMLCAEFLAALFRPCPGPVTPLFDADRCPDAVDVAVEHLRSPVLADGTPDIRAVCTRTLALLRYLAVHPGGLRLVPGRADLPASAAESVLQEATKARANERQARRDLPELGRAVQLLGTFALAFAILALIELWHVATVDVDPWWLVLPAIAAPALLLVGVRWYYRRSGVRAERRDLRLGQTAAGLLALAAAAVLATLAWPHDGPVVAAIGVVLLAGTTAFAALHWVLLRLRLAPAWARLIPQALAEVKSPLAFITQRTSKPADER